LSSIVIKDGKATGKVIGCWLVFSYLDYKNIETSHIFERFLAWYYC
jgi:hypothetical protein